MAPTIFSNFQDMIFEAFHLEPTNHNCPHIFDPYYFWYRWCGHFLLWSGIVKLQLLPICLSEMINHVKLYELWILKHYLWMFCFVNLQWWKNMTSKKFILVLSDLHLSKQTIEFRGRNLVKKLIFEYGWWQMIDSPGN